MKKLLLTIIISLMGCLMFTACSKSNEADVSDKPQDKAETAQEEESSETETEEPEKKKDEPSENDDKEEVSSDDGIDLIGDVYIRKKDDTHYRDNKDLLIDYDYELIALGTESQDKYPGLYKNLLVVNDLIATDEGNCFMSDVNSVSGMTEEDFKTATDNELMPHKQQWNIFARRTDREVFSLVVRSMTGSSVDYNHIRYTGYNFETGTGEELKLSDVVKDEDAFLGMVTDKVNDYIKPIYSDDPRTVDTSEIKEQLDTGARGNWTIDPQGITVWFGSYIFAPEDVHVTVLYSEDKKGTVFNSKYADHVPDEWTMSIPMYTNAFFDAEDDGKADYVAIYEERDYYSEDDRYGYLTAIEIEYNLVGKTFEGFDDPYDMRFSLIHEDGKTFLLNVYQEYDYSFMETYTLYDGKVKDNGGISGCPASIPYDEIEKGDHSVPDRLVTDPDHIPVDSTTDMLSTCGSSREYHIDKNGKIEPIDTYYTIGEDNRFTITLKMDLTGVPVVDGKTHEETSETVDLKSGDKITMEYTDGDTYVDCETKDGKLVRIKLYHEPDEWQKHVKQDGKDIPVNDAFDDMRFAG